jgi:hypothetical protein
MFFYKIDYTNTINENYIEKLAEQDDKDKIKLI